MPPKRPRAGAAPASSRAPRAPSAGRGGGAARGSRGRGRGGRARALDEDVRDAAGGAADDDDGFDFDESGAGSGTSRVGAGAGAGGGGAADDDADVAESGDAKRLRLARDYLDRLEADVGAKAGDGDEDEDDDERRGVLRNKAVSQRLADDASLISGTLIRPIAAKIIALGVDEHAAVVFKSPQRFPVTCLALTADGGTAFMGSKDCTIVRWEITLPSTGAAAADKAVEAAVTVQSTGRRRTRRDVARQLQLAASGTGRGLRMIAGGTFGGGRIGPDQNSDNEDGAEGAAAATIVHGVGGVSSITARVAAPVRGVAAVGDEEGADGAVGRDAARARVDMLKSVADFGIAGHWGEVLSVAVTADGAVVASGGRDKTVRVWDGRRLRSRETLVGHKDAVTALSFLRGPAKTLFSAGLDRLVKVWSCDEMTLVETLFGHQAEIAAIDTPLGGAAGARERVVSAGADATARLWKVPEQTQLVFRPGGAPPRIESVRAVGEGVFLTGDADGALALWSVLKKRPLAVISHAHGSGVSVPLAADCGESTPPAPSGELTFALAPQGSVLTLSADADGGGVPDALLNDIAAVTGARTDALSAGYCHGITALAVMPHADVFASGSGDGFIRIWALVAGGRNAPAGVAAFRGIKFIGAVRVRGIVNGLAFSDDGRTLCAAVASEHRLGRWWSYKDATDGLAVIRLKSA